MHVQSVLPFWRSYVSKRITDAKGIQVTGLELRVGSSICSLGLYRKPKGLYMESTTC